MDNFKSNGWRLAAARRGRVPEPMPIIRSRFVPLNMLDACGITDDMFELGSGGFNRRV